jgi:hypothetical protein
MCSGYSRQDPKVVEVCILGYERERVPSDLVINDRVGNVDRNVLEHIRSLLARMKTRSVTIDRQSLMRLVLYSPILTDNSMMKKRHN